jgi:hypothetical protein
MDGHMQFVDQPAIIVRLATTPARSRLAADQGDVLAAKDPK